MLLSSLAFMFMAWRVPVVSSHSVIINPKRRSLTYQQQKRLFHIVTALITTFATLSYYAMATGEGSSFTSIVIKDTPSTVEQVFRQVYWARYVDWSLTTPLLLLDLSFLAGLSGADIFVAVVADLIMVLTGLFAALARKESVRWGWYIMACIAYLFIVYILAVGGRRAVSAKSNATAKLFAAIGGFTLVLWTLYPVVWGISDGARKWSVDAEIVSYAILDVLAKPVFGFWLLFAHAKNASSVEGFWSNGLTGEGALRLDDDEA
jgi:bacteriorhodopsin